MSVKASNWAWEQKLAPSAKLTLLALADAADDRGECWPRLKTIATMSGTSERTVQRALREFEAAGLLEVTRRFTAAGRQTSNGYRLALLCYPDKLSPPETRCQGEGDKGFTGRVTQPRHPEGGVAVSPLEPPLNPPKEPSPQPPVPSGPSALQFPNRLASLDRHAIEALLINVDQAAAQSLLDELAGAMEIPNSIKTTPVRWLRALTERMRQGRFVPTAGLHITERRAQQQRHSERSRDDRKADGLAAPTVEEREAVRQKLLALRAILTKPKVTSPNGSTNEAAVAPGRPVPTSSVTPQERKSA